MKTLLVALMCLFITYISFAQKKTGVVVFGATPGAIAAAIQSAHSGVKTVLVDQGNFDVVDLTPADKAHKVGIYAEFLQRVDSLQKSMNFKNNASLTPAYTATVFKGWTDTIKNLTIIKKATVKKIEKDGKGWEIEFTDRSEIKADLVIDATIGSSIAKRVGLSPTQLVLKPEMYTDKIYRTSIAMVGITGESSPHYLPISFLLNKDTENFLILGGNIQPTLLAGQGAGASAAYCAFFKTSTKDLDVRKTQTELLTFKSQFIRFDDINATDSTAVSIQKVTITGILKGYEKENKLLFMPDSTISSEDIRLPFREYYSRSQIWFLDNKADKLTLENALSLIKFVGSRAEELNKEVQKGWKTSLKLTGEFDLKKIINRREFAVLLATYLQPNIVAINLEGNVRR